MPVETSSIGPTRVMSVFSTVPRSPCALLPDIPQVELGVGFGDSLGYVKTTPRALNGNSR